MKKIKLTTREIVDGIPGKVITTTHTMKTNQHYISALKTQKDITISGSDLKFVERTTFDKLAYPKDSIKIEDANFIFKANITNKEQKVYFVLHGSKR